MIESNSETIYKLLIYITIDERFFLVDKIYGENIEQMRAIAEAKQQANRQYVVLLMSYKLDSVKIVTGDNDNDSTTSGSSKQI